MSPITGSLIGEIEFSEGTVFIPFDDEHDGLIAEIERNEIFGLIEQYPVVQDVVAFDAIYEKLANKNQPNGYAGLNSNGKINASLFQYDYYNEDFSLTLSDITNKKIVLSKTPIYPQSVVLQPHGALPQLYGIDYVVVSNEVHWSGLGLDGFLNEVGEGVRVSYKSED